MGKRGATKVLRAYQGYFDNGRFVSPDGALIPDKTRVIVTLLGDEITPTPTTRAQRQFDAVKAFISDASGQDELSAEDYADLESGKYKLRMSGRAFDV